MFLEMEKAVVAHIQVQQRAVLHDSQHQDQVMMNLTQIKGTQTKASQFRTIQSDRYKSRERNKKNSRYIILAITGVAN